MWLLKFAVPVVVLSTLFVSLGFTETQGVMHPFSTSSKVVEGSGDQEQCTLEYKEYKDSYLQFAKKPKLIGYITSYEDCFRKCCYIDNFSCKSFSYLSKLKLCFLMNTTQSDEGVVLTHSEIYTHVEIIVAPVQTLATMTTDVTERIGTVIEDKTTPSTSLLPSTISSSYHNNNEKNNTTHQPQANEQRLRNTENKELTSDVDEISTKTPKTTKSSTPSRRTPVSAAGSFLDADLVSSALNVPGFYMTKAFVASSRILPISSKQSERSTASALQDVVKTQRATTDATIRDVSKTTEDWMSNNEPMKKPESPATSTKSGKSNGETKPTGYINNEVINISEVQTTVSSRGHDSESVTSMESLTSTNFIDLLTSTLATPNNLFAEHSTKENFKDVSTQGAQYSTEVSLSKNYFIKTTSVQSNRRKQPSVDPTEKVTPSAASTKQSLDKSTTTKLTKWEPDAKITDKPSEPQPPTVSKTKAVSSIVSRNSSMQNSTNPRNNTYGQPSPSSTPTIHHKDISSSTTPSKKERKTTTTSSPYTGRAFTMVNYLPGRKVINFVDEDVRRGRVDKITSCGKDCLNGGECKVFDNSQNGPLCRCKAGFYGELCESKVIVDKKAEISWWIIVVIAVAVILFLSVIGTYLTYRVYKRHMVGKYNIAKGRRFEVASTNTPDNIDYGLGASYTSLAWQDRPPRSLFATGTLSTTASV